MGVDLKVYLSGPMTGVKDLNREAFRQAAEVLRMLGHDVINPHDLHEEPGLSHADYMRRDLTVLMDWGVEAVFVLPGWRYSEGSLAEVVCAQAIGIDVFDFAALPAEKPIRKVVGYAMSGFSMGVHVATSDKSDAQIEREMFPEEHADHRAGHPRYYELLERMATVHSDKSLDYADGDHTGDPLRNLRGSAEMGIAPWKGTLVRISDKYNRLLTFARRESYAVKDESVADTLVDLANYALLALVLYEESNGSS